MNWCQTERMNLKYVEINWNVIFSKIILILIRKGKRAVPVQLYIFIIFMCLQRWIWINLKLMNWCQTERMNLKYVEINWNVIFSKIILILIRKGKRGSTRTTLYFYHFYVSTKVNMNKFETNELMSNWKNELEICWNKLKCNFFKNHSHLDSKRQKSSTHTTLYFYQFYVSTKVNINKFETNPLLSNWKNELEICWNNLKCNFFKNHSHLDSKRQKSSTRTNLYFYHFYVSTKVNMNKFETNELMSNWKNELEICWNKLKCNFFKNHLSSWFWKGKRAVPVQLYIFIIFMCLQRWIWINLKLMNWCQTERMNLKYVEINWNVIFSKIILILILKGKRAVPIQLYIFKFVVSILCSSIAFTGNFNDQKSFSSWF